jgi:hypothetical protein
MIKLSNCTGTWGLESTTYKVCEDEVTGLNYVNNSIQHLSERKADNSWTANVSLECAHLSYLLFHHTEL